MRDITDLSHDAIKIKGKEIDDSAIGDNKALIFKSASGKIEYGAASGMVMHGNEYHTKTFAEACCQICSVDTLPNIAAAGYTVILNSDKKVYVEIEGDETACGCKFPKVDILPTPVEGEAVFLSTDQHLYIGI